MPVPFARTASQTQPTFSRDFAGLKTLDHGAGPSITFTRASNATFFSASGVLQTASNDQPRFDHDPATGASRGLLIEEARTNSIRNSQAGGAVVGAPGTIPTNWDFSAPTGISREVVATGTANGLAYIDIKVSGTSTQVTQGNCAIRFDGPTQVAASSGQSWSASCYIAIIAGSSANLSNVALGVIERNSGGGLLERTSSSTISGSSLVRYAASRTFTNASTAHVTAQIELFNIDNGDVIDITLRIAAPQLEQGAFPTSYIPTTTAAATRAADSAVVTPISSFYNQSEGTLFAEATLRGIASGNFPRVVQFDEASSSDNRFNILCTSTPAASAEYRTSGVGQLNTTEIAITLGTVFRTVAAVATNNGRVATNGALVGSDDTSLTMNSANTRMRIGTEAGGSFFTGHIRKIAYWPKRLSNTLLQKLTT